MRKHVMWVSATLALALGTVSACGGSPSQSSGTQGASCVNASAAHHAYIVVEHGSATTLQKCVGFSGDAIDGQSLMDKSGLKYQAQDFGGTLGKAVCQIDNEPAHYDKCFSDSGPWWLLFVDANGQWASAQTGYTTIMLHDKQALGWVYTASSSPSPPPLPKA